MMAIRINENHQYFLNMFALAFTFISPEHKYVKCLSLLSYSTIAQTG